MPSRCGSQHTPKTLFWNVGWIETGLTGPCASLTGLNLIQGELLWSVDFERFRSSATPAPRCLYRNRRGDSRSYRVFPQECSAAIMTPTIKYRPEDNAAYIRLSQQT